MGKTLDYDSAARIICRQMRLPPTDRAAANGILESFRVAGLIQRGPGKRNRSVTRITPPAYVERTIIERRGPTMVAVTDEWGDTKDFPMGEIANAEIARVKEVRRSAERARLVSILGNDT